MSAVVRAEQAVAEARARLVTYLAHTGLSTPRAEANIDALVRAVRELVASEIERSEFQSQPAGSEHYRSGYGDGLGDAARIAREGHAALVHPDTQEQP